MGSFRCVQWIFRNWCVKQQPETEKKGDQIFIFTNGKHLYTQKVAESGRALDNFVGVGVVQKGMAKGQISHISFQMITDKQ